MTHLRGNSLIKRLLIHRKAIKILKHFYCGVVIYNAMNYNETRVFHSYFTVILQTLQGAPVQYFHQACLDLYRGAL